MENPGFDILTKKDLIDDFLFIPKKYKNIKKASSSKIYYIYKIYNKDDKEQKPIYIGKTTDLRRRASQYVYNIERVLTTNRPILKHMRILGLKKFVMTPIYYTFNEDDICDKEKEYIIKYDTINIGFNSKLTSSKSIKNNEKFKFVHSYHNADGKRLKSKLFFIINPQTKVGYICTGLKLAGELNNGISKDNIKTAARRGIPRNGFYMYYLNFIDYEVVLKEVKRKINKGIFYGPKTTKELINMQCSCKDMYKNFVKYADYIKKYLKTYNNPENFDIKFVTQSDESNTGYIMSDPKEFIEKYKDYIYKIYQ